MFVERDTGLRPVGRIRIRVYIWIWRLEVALKYSESIEPVTTLKTKSAELIRRAKETGQPIVITQNGKATAVLVDVKSFEREREALLLLRHLVVGEGEIGRGKGVPHQEALRHFKRRLKVLRGG